MANYDLTRIQMTLDRDKQRYSTGGFGVTYQQGCE